MLLTSLFNFKQLYTDKLKVTKAHQLVLSIIKSEYYKLTITYYDIISKLLIKFVFKYIRQNSSLRGTLNCLLI